jgi:hypothetical protein
MQNTQQQQQNNQIAAKMGRGKNLDSKPRGRMTAYAFFVQTCREEHKKNHPEESVIFAEFSRKCAERWKVSHFVLSIRKSSTKKMQSPKGLTRLEKDDFSLIATFLILLLIEFARVELFLIEKFYSLRKPDFAKNMKWKICVAINFFFFWFQIVDQILYVGGIVHNLLCIESFPNFFFSWN